MQRRSLVMSGLSSIALAACGGGGTDGDIDTTIEEEDAALMADGRESAAGLANTRQAFTLLEPVNGTETSGIAVNNRGQAVGWTGAGEAGDFGTTLWYRGSATRFPTVAGAGSGAGASLNEWGRIVGHSAARNLGSHATMWVRGQPVDLGTLNDAQASGATSINNAGLVVGWSYVAPGPVGAIHAILWRSGRLIDLGTLGGAASSASDINERGVIVGWATSDQKAGTLGAIWHRGRITELPGLGGTETYPYAINDLGVAVGSSSLAVQDSLRAVVWRSAGSPPVDLGTLGGQRAIARNINNAGQIVGWSSLADDDGGGHAALWAGSSVVDLNTFLDDDTRNAGWVLTDAIGLNDRGWVTGDAFNSITGARRGYLLVVGHRH